jgi:hypothetical protein
MLRRASYYSPVKDCRWEDVRRVQMEIIVQCVTPSNFFSYVQETVSVNESTGA